MILKKAGKDNTEVTLQEAIRVAQERDIKYLVVASTSGNTALEALKLTDRTSIKLIVVTHNTGFSESGKQSFDPAVREQLERAGAVVHTGTMVLRNLGAAIRDRFKFSETEIVNATLRMFGQGMKVVAEMAAMTSDAGLIPPTDVMVVAGTGRGADTAAVVKADSSNRFFDIKIREIVVKPFDF